MYDTLKVNVDHKLDVFCPMFQPRPHVARVFIDGWECRVIEFRKMPLKIRGRDGALVKGIVLRVGSKRNHSQVCSEHVVPEYWYLHDTGQERITVSGHVLSKVAPRGFIGDPHQDIMGFAGE